MKANNNLGSGNSRGWGQEARVAEGIKLQLPQVLAGRLSYFPPPPPHPESCACAEDHTLREEGGDRISRYEEEKEEEKRDHRLPPGPRAALKVVGRGRVGGDHPQYRPPEVSWRPGIPLPKVSGRGPK